MRHTSIALLIGLLLVIGCIRRPGGGAVVQGIGKLTLVDSPGITLHTTGSRGGTSSGTTSLSLHGELIAEKGALLPPDLAQSVAQRIRTYLQQSGCNITGGGNGQGFEYSGDSAAKNVGIKEESVDFNVERSRGRVDILVVERDYQFGEKHIVGQLVVLARSS